MDKLNSITIEKLDDEFNGIVYKHGRRMLVGKALPGEKALVEEIKTEDNVTLCSLKEIKIASDERIVAPCPFYPQCGGCQILHIPYEKQLELKTNLIKKKFSEIGVDQIENCVGVGINDYRNKTHIVFGKENNNTIAGFFNDETHKVVDIPACICHGSWYSVLRCALLEWIKKYNISIYNPITQKGTIRFAVARHYKKKIMVTLVVTKMPDINLNTLYDCLAACFEQVSLYVNINNEISNQVLAGDFKYIAGPTALIGKFCGVDFRLSPDSFFQINSIIAERIYKEVLRQIKRSDVKKVIDLFSGIGITSIMFAKTKKKVESVEIVKAAVNDAIVLGKINNVQNIKFNCGDCAKILPSIKDVNNSILFLDPPRRGIGKSVCITIGKARPNEIVYLSCNYESLIKDLKMLMQYGYVVNKVIPYDMFAGTKHIETLVCLHYETC